MSKKVIIDHIVYEDGEWIVTDNSSIRLGHGYLVVGNEDVVCFYVDVRESPTGRAYAVSSSSTVEGYPSLAIDSGRAEDVWSEDDSWTEVCFPEFAGFSVFATGGGKTLSICLRKSQR